VILVRFQGTCGNQLWQYAVARIYAQENGHQLYKDMSSSIRDDLIHFKNATNLSSGHGNNGFIDERTTRYVDGHLHNFTSLLESYDAIFNGYFQRFEYIRDHKKQIQQWFEVERELPIALNDSDLVLSIRRGWNGYPTDQCPPASFYEKIIEAEDPSRIILCTDTFSDEYFNFLSKYENVHLADHDMMTQFCLIKSASKVVLSPSTFCWWAAWLGNAQTIYYPWTNDLIPTSTRANWWVDNESRYIITKENLGIQT